MSANDMLTIRLTASFEGTRQDRSFTVKRKDEGTFEVAHIDQPDPRIQATIQSFCDFVSTDATILKMTIAKTPFNHDTEVVAGIANRIFKAQVANPNLKHTVVTLEGLYNLGHVLKDCATLPEKAVLTLGLRDMAKVPTDEGSLAALTALQPSRLGLRLLKGVSAEFIAAITTPLQGNPSLKMLIVEDCTTETATGVAELINTIAALESIGLARDALDDPAVAKILADKLTVDSITGKLTISDANIEGSVAKSLAGLVEKLASLKTLDISYNTMSNDGFGAICTAVSKHATLKTLSAQECKIEGGPATDFTGGLNNIFTTNTSLETLKLDGVNLFACDSSTWAGLASTKTLKKLSLHKCFQNSNAWMEIYKGVSDKTSSLTASWTLKNVDSTLDLTLGATTVALARVSHSKFKEFDWILPMVKEMSAAKHFFAVSSSAMGSTVAAALPDLCACTGVAGLDLQLKSKAEALSVVTSFLSDQPASAGEGDDTSGILMAILPKAVSTLSEVKMSWESPTATEGRSATGISVKLSE